MLWKVLTPFTTTSDVGWLPEHIKSGNHSFEAVPATYDHDRSRRSTDALQWRDYIVHAVRAWDFKPGRRRRVGYLTAFPQLAVCTGSIKRLTRSRSIIVAWLFNMGSMPGGIKGAFARFGMRSVDLIVVHSTAEVDLYSQWLGLPPERFCFVPLSISVEHASGAVVDEGEPFVLALGTANRDYATLFTAIEPLRLKTIVVAGASALEGLAIPPCVEVRTGLSLAECHALSRAARINVIPLKEDKNPSGQVTLLETMVQGKAVVATDCAGTRDYIVTEQTGVLVPAGDALALRETISRLWNDDQTRRTIGAAGAAYVAATSTFETVALKMESLLDDLSGLH